MIKAIIRKSDNKIQAFNEVGHGTFGWSNDQYKEIKIPDQNVDQFYEGEPPNETLKEIYYPTDIQTFSAEKEAQVKLRGQTYASIAEVDTSRSEKYLKVEKTIDGNNSSVWAYADYSLLLAYQNNDLATGDIVIIEFVDNDLDKCYAQGKIVGF